MLFWHAVVKPSPRLTAYYLFTADFNFPDSLSPETVTPSSPFPSHCLAFCLHFTPSLTPLSFQVPPNRLSGSPISQSFDPVNTSNSILSWDAQLHWLPIFWCSNPFILSSFIFVYLLRPGGQRKNCWSI